MSGIMVIQTVEQLEDLLQQSHVMPLFLYKHSTNCGSSRVAYSSLFQFITRYTEIGSQFHFAMIRTIEEKSISQYATAHLHVTHMSPQIILVSNGNALWYLSHQHINSTQLYNGAMQFLQQQKKSKSQLPYMP